MRVSEAIVHVGLVASTLALVWFITRTPVSSKRALVPEAPEAVSAEHRPWTTPRRSSSRRPAVSATSRAMGLGSNATRRGLKTIKEYLADPAFNPTGAKLPLEERNLVQKSFFDAWRNELSTLSWRREQAEAAFLARKRALERETPDEALEPFATMLREGPDERDAVPRAKPGESPAIDALDEEWNRLIDRAEADVRARIAASVKR